ncbi:MAG: hypothetical protein EHM32_07740 [Spirochaetales bacterium]|nr:MAG: hypothetical protein EHM32_07740 [Spirochaetales bacterium]
MRINVRLRDLLVQALVESMTVDKMVMLAQRVIPYYNLYERTGFPVNMSIPNRDAARQIIDDIHDNRLVLQFAGLLVIMHTEGLAGRRYVLPHVREIMAEIHGAGFVFDWEFQTFVEDSRIRRTRNWGALVEGQEYVFSFLSLDIVGSTALVREYPEETIKATYGDLRGIVQRSIERREGRLWSWEGDGGLVAFYFGKKFNAATLSAVDILHDLFLYNRLECRLKIPLSVRLAVHGGPCEFRHNTEDIVSDTINRTLEIESEHTMPDSIAVSNVVYLALEPLLQEMLYPLSAGDRSILHGYELRWEE